MDQALAITIATVLAGAIGVPAVQGIKALVEATGHKLEGRLALYVTVGTSLILALIAMYLAGAFRQPVTIELVGGMTAGVFTIATVIYKSIAPKINQSGAVISQEQIDKLRGDVLNDVSNSQLTLDEKNCLDEALKRLSDEKKIVINEGGQR